MRSAKLRAIGRVSFRWPTPLHRMRRRATRATDSDFIVSGNAEPLASDLGVIEDDYAMVIGIFPGFGTYWEAQIVVSGESQQLRSYKLASIVSEIIDVLRKYERDYG
jgi:hypothetical protein